MSQAVRRTLAVVAAGLILTGCGGSGRRTTAVLLRAQIDPAAPGMPMPRSFLGLSSDWNVVLTRTGVPATGPNALYDRLIANLGRYGGGPPTLRVGGDYQDTAVWDPTGQITATDRALGLTTPITYGTLAGLAMNARITGQRMILGLNLAADDPALAATEARQILRFIPKSDILALSIGNEPDDYPIRVRSQHQAGGRLVTEFVRGRSFSGADYLGEWGQVAQAVQQAAPGVPLAGTDGYDQLLPASEFLGTEHSRLAVFTQHYYAASSCDSRGRPYPPTSPLYMTVERLVAGRGTVSLLPLRTAVTAAARYRIPVRVDELNSIACGGRAALGDSFGAALWALDDFFSDALLGIQGIDLHGDDFREAPFVFVYDRSAHRWRGYVGDLYYAMLAFAQAAGSGGTLLPAATRQAKPAPGADARLFVVRQPDGALHILVVNLDQRRSGSVAITVPAATANASLARLQGPGLTGHAGVTFAGQTVNTVALGGALTGPHRSTQVHPGRGVYRFYLPAASAATLTVPPPAGA